MSNDLITKLGNINPSVGRIVHIKTSNDAVDEMGSRVTICVAAIVTSVIDKDTGVIGCTAFSPSPYSGLPGAVMGIVPPAHAISSIRYGFTENTWHWPERD